MRVGLKVQFWVETVLAAVSGLLFVLTLAWPQWIESVFGLDPDQHSGAAEWGIVVGLLALTIAFSALARASRRLLVSA